MNKIHPLTKYRQEHGLSMQKLGDKLGCHKSTISRLESGVIHLSGEDAVRFEKELGIPRADLRPDLFVY